MTTTRIAWLAAVALASCNFDSSGVYQLPPDGGPADAALVSDGRVLDGGAIDGGAIDGGAIDAGAVDAGAIDGGAIDAGAIDGGAIDGGAVDAGAIDAGAIDAGAIDAGAIDAGAIDASPPDAAPAARCGDGVLDSGESCDDSNVAAYDGCSATCAWECGGAVVVAPVVPGVPAFGTIAVGTGSLNSCGGYGRETTFSLTLTSPADVIVTTDLPAPPEADTAIYVRPDCDSTAGQLGCANQVGWGGSTLMLTDVPAGTWYVVVDSNSAGGGNFQLSVTLVVPLGAACDPAGIASICEAGTVCTAGTCQLPPVTCDAGATALVLDPAVTDDISTIGAGNDYQLACAAMSSAEDAIFVATVVAGGARELLVELESQTDGYDFALDLTSAFADPATSLLCLDQQSPVMGWGTMDGVREVELAVYPLAATGCHYVVVDGISGGASSGDANIGAWLRDLVGTGAGCAFDLVASRCTSGFCRDHDDDRVTTCGTMTNVVDILLNESPCSAQGPYHADMAIDGIFNEDAGDDNDCLRIEPTVNSTLSASAFTVGGGCAFDMKMTLRSGTPTSVGMWCNTLMLADIASSDNEGIGACPVLDTIDVNAGQRYTLCAVRQSGSGDYTLVVDLTPR